MKSITLFLFLFTYIVIAEENIKEKEKEPVKFEYVRIITDRDFEEVKSLLVLYLKENDLNVWKEVNSKEETIRYTIIYSCSERYLKEVIKQYPRLGNIFPCKILIREDDEGNIIISIINAEVLSRVYKGIVPQEVLDLVKENYEYLKSIVDQI